MFSGAWSSATGSKSAKDTICGPLIFTDLPCLCAGGSGFTLLLPLRCGGTGGLSSSSDVDLSYDVRGVSLTMFSTADCRLMVEVSVLLLLSTNVRPGGLAIDPVFELFGVAFPVISRFLNAFTSMEARGIFLSAGSGAVYSSLDGVPAVPSIVARVRLNGLKGMFEDERDWNIVPAISSIPSSSLLVSDS